MRLVAWSLLLGCAATPQPAVVVTKPMPAVVAPLRVHTVIKHLDDDKYLQPDTPFAVVLTAPVAPVANALALLTDDGARLPGRTAWLNPQLVAFYPTEPLPVGRDVSLRLQVELRARDGSVLSPGQLASGAMPPFPCAAPRAIFGGDFKPMDALRLGIPPLLPTQEVERLARLTVEGEALPFLVQRTGELVDFRAKVAFPPGKKVTLSFESGPVVKTAIGRICVESFSVTTSKGFSLARIGEYDDKCKASFPKNVYTQVCDQDVMHLYFTSPVSPESAKKYIHPSLPFATTGDTRGHRFDVAISKVPLKLVVDHELRDIFGQQLSSSSEVVLIRKTP